MTEIVSKQFKMSGASFTGTDKNGEPFTLHADTGYQEYEKPDIVFMTQISGTVNRKSDGKKITDNISAQRGQYNRVNKTVTLYGNVRVDSSNGDKIRTEELVIRL